MRSLGLFTSGWPFSFGGQGRHCHIHDYSMTKTLSLFEMFAMFYCFSKTRVFLRYYVVFHLTLKMSDPVVKRSEFV